MFAHRRSETQSERSRILAELKALAETLYRQASLDATVGNERGGSSAKQSGAALPLVIDYCPGVLYRAAPRAGAGYVRTYTVRSAAYSTAAACTERSWDSFTACNTFPTTTASRNKMIPITIACSRIVNSDRPLLMAPPCFAGDSESLFSYWATSGPFLKGETGFPQSRYP